MLYMLMIYTQESSWTSKSPAEQAEVMKRHEDLERELRASGKYQSCAGLEPTASATTVRVRGGKKLVTDGPFAESKEQFGGFYLIEARDLDDAIAIAARIPGADIGCVEVRPVAVQSLLAGD